jgi:putative endonuclease
MAFFVYVLASERNGTLYIGMADDLVKRIWQHRNDFIPSFTQRYGVKMLLVRVARVAGVGIHARAPAQEME